MSTNCCLVEHPHINACIPPQFCLCVTAPSSSITSEIWVWTLDHRINTSCYFGCDILFIPRAGHTQSIAAYLSPYSAHIRPWNKTHPPKKIPVFTAHFVPIVMHSSNQLITADLEINGHSFYVIFPPPQPKPYGGIYWIDRLGASEGVDHFWCHRAKGSPSRRFAWPYFRVTNPLFLKSEQLGLPFSFKLCKTPRSSTTLCVLNVNVT